MVSRHFLDDSLRQFRKLKAQADKALAQTKDQHLFFTLDDGSNSIATIMKHMSGNMRSRWTDFLTTDGEKPDRDRDTEFEISNADTRARLLESWEDGWSRLFGAVGALAPEDVEKTIYIRGEAHTVLEAINRQATHYAAHVGQLVLLAKHFAGARWQTLSIPRGKSKEFEVAKGGAPYGVKGPGGVTGEPGR